MQIQLSEQTAALAAQQAEQFGYGQDVSAYIAHIIATSQTPPPGVPSPRSKEELDALLEAGIASGVADGDWKDFMDGLRSQVEAKTR
ncbi:hypothetical protein [Aeoliella mucimassa]|uniref:Uncharacterized protein n=1 Tax=Aeoliella mucimassa TaxID=2527972 RepID=A0A518AI99_9BACT|nr:hypothetical protein [Aeoliella mucimassa]QDU54461.1 hypothetical protein Pan181_06430 [Aeoliella mucimassa]